MNDNKRRQRARESILAQRQERAAQWIASREVKNEESIVTFLLDQLNVPEKKWKLLKLCKQRTGTGRLTLDLFDEFVPNFPLLMGCAPLSKVDKLHADNRCTLPALFRRFEEAPFVRAYQDFLYQEEHRAGGRALGLLFHRKGIPHGLVIHNDVGLKGYQRTGTRFVYEGTGDAHLVVERLDLLVEAICSSKWRPKFAF
jgi:hypothetical protein